MFKDNTRSPAGQETFSQTVNNEPGPKRTGAVIRRYVELLTGNPDTEMCWRFLPEPGNTEAAVVAGEKAERLKRKEAGDTDWRKFSLKRNFDGTLDDVIDAMREHQKMEWGIFCVVNEGGRNGASITKIRALFIDLDDAGWRKIAWHVEPDFIVYRDDMHAHVYWLVGDCPVDQFTTAQLRLIKHYGADPSVNDLPRVLRVPGTRHLKDRDHPHVLKLLEMREPWEPKRSVAELMAGLPELDPEELKRHKSGASVGDPVLEKVLRLTLTEIPSEDLRRADWRDVVGGIRATNLVGDTDGERRRAIAHAWMKKGGHPIGNYDDAEGIDQVFDGMPPKEGGLGYGTLHHLAQKHNPDFKLNPHAPRDPHDTFAPFLDRLAEQGNTGDETPGYPDGRRVKLTKASDIAMRRITWLWNGYLAQGKFQLLGGVPSTLKTTIAISFAKTVTTGEKWPDGTQAPQGDVVMYGGEDGASDTLIPRFAAMGGNLDRFHVVDGAFNEDGTPRMFDPATDMAGLMEEAAKLPDLKLVIIEPIVTMVLGDDFKNNQVRRGLQPLVDFAERTGAAIIGISHFTKGSSGRLILERMAGSLGYGALPRVVFGAIRPTDESKPLRFIRAKSNIGPQGGGFEYRTVESLVPGMDGYKIGTVAWGRGLFGPAQRLMEEIEERDKGGRPAKEQADAASWLFELLGDGPMSAKDVADAAEAEGYSRNTVLRARAANRAKIKVAQTPGKPSGGWTWYRVPTENPGWQVNDTDNPFRTLQ